MFMFCFEEVHIDKKINVRVDTLLYMYSYHEHLYKVDVLNISF